MKSDDEDSTEDVDFSAVMMLSTLFAVIMRSCSSHSVRMINCIMVDTMGHDGLASYWEPGATATSRGAQSSSLV